METALHMQLKRLAAVYLVRSGYAAVAMEVRCPISRFRVDVAGWLDSTPLAGSGDRRLTGRLDGAAVNNGSTSRQVATRQAHRVEPRAIMIECKQSRTDFLRDSRHLAKLLTLREQLHRILSHIEENCVKQREPHLRRSGTSLFTQLEAWDLASSRSGAYHKTLEKLQRLDQRIHGQTKFAIVARYRLADRLYVLAPRGMIRQRELPWGWGLLECREGALRAGARSSQDADERSIEVAVEAPQHVPTAAHRQRLLRNIAVAATRDWTRMLESEHRSRAASATLFDPT